MAENTGMTAVLVNPAEQIGADLTPEQMAKIEEMRNELAKYGLKLTTRAGKPVDDPTPNLSAVSSPQEAYGLLDQAFAAEGGTIIGVFPRQLGTGRRYVGAVAEVSTSGRKAWRFAVHYPFTSAKSGKKRNEGAKLLFAGPELAREMNVAPGTMLALSYINYPGDDAEDIAPTE